MLAQIFKVASNTQTWTQVTFDLTPYKGQTIQIYFNAHDDGYGDLTYMYLDDVSITKRGATHALQLVPVTPCRLVDTRPTAWRRRSHPGRNVREASPYRKRAAATFRPPQQPIR